MFFFCEWPKDVVAKPKKELVAEGRVFVMLSDSTLSFCFWCPYVFVIVREVLTLGSHHDYFYMFIRKKSKIIMSFIGTISTITNTTIESGVAAIPP